MNDGVEIIKLTPERWADDRAFRLEALVIEPQAFGSSFQKNLLIPEEVWKERAQAAYEGIYAWKYYAQENSTLIGSVGASLSKEHPSVAIVFGVYVAPPARGKGIGAKLMEALIDAIKQNKDIKRITLTVNKNQTSAVSLYERCGFVITGEIEGQMGDGKVYKEYEMEIVLY
jgi:ribosomal protein S18 acetylase RimI-like enzyme